MTNKRPRIPVKLNRHLAHASSSQAGSLAEWLEEGGALVTGDAILALRDLLPGLHAKTSTVDSASRLRRRLELFITYFEETLGDPLVNKTARRDVAFALFYFLKGFDRIPDSVPEIGLLDDALIVESALFSHTSVLREHWIKRGRPWPDNP